MNEEATNLKTALVTILREIDRQREVVSGGEIRLLTVDEFVDYVDSGGEIVRDPVGHSLRLGVRAIGEILARRHSNFVMRAVAAAVLEETSSGIHANIIDKNWDGLTDKHGKQWVA